MTILLMFCLTILSEWERTGSGTVGMWGVGGKRQETEMKRSAGLRLKDPADRAVPHASYLRDGGGADLSGPIPRWTRSKAKMGGPLGGDVMSSGGRVVIRWQNGVWKGMDRICASGIECAGLGDPFGVVWRGEAGAWDTVKFPAGVTLRRETGGGRGRGRWPPGGHAHAECRGNGDWRLSFRPPRQTEQTSNSFFSLILRSKSAIWLAKMTRQSCPLVSITILGSYGSGEKARKGRRRKERSLRRYRQRKGQE